MSYDVYKLLHLGGLFLVVMALAGLAFAATSADGRSPHPWRRRAGMAHGIGLAVLLVGGFGMLARLGMTHGLPGWVHAKLGLWVALGGAIALIKRKPQWAAPQLVGLFLLVILAAALALYKPF